MKSLLKFIVVVAFLIVSFGFANKVQSGLTSDTFITSSYILQENPFENFIGEWVLKDDIFENNFGGEYRADVNPNRSFVAKKMGTSNSMLWVEDFAGFKVDIFWTYDFKKEQIHHLSMSDDIAKGMGKFKENGDLELKLVYENGCEGCYRIYSFQWKSENEFFFRGKLHRDGEPTGDFYGGTFIRKVK
jgi:hypothetical protein